MSAEELRTAGVGLTAPMPPNPQGMPSSGTVETPIIEPVATELPPTPIDMAKMQSLGGQLLSMFKTYENHRKLSELRWARNLRQFLGEYDPEIKKNLDTNRSMAYPRITRVK